MIWTHISTLVAAFGMTLAYVHGKDCGECLHGVGLSCWRIAYCQGCDLWGMRNPIPAKDDGSDREYWRNGNIQKTDMALFFFKNLYTKLHLCGTCRLCNHVPKVEVQQRSVAQYTLLTSWNSIKDLLYYRTNVECEGGSFYSNVWET